jgi:hypothetical protein
MMSNSQANRLLLILCLVFAASAEAQEPPLDDSCKPNSLADKLKHSYDSKSFYQKKQQDILKFKEDFIKHARLVPLNHKQDLENARVEMYREAIMVPEMYQGEMLAITIQVNRELLAAITESWVASAAYYRKNIDWADKCLNYIDAQNR